MKLVTQATIGVCLFVSVSAKAQSTGDTADKFTPAVIAKDKDSVQKSENKKEEYRSKEWQQGDVVTDTVNRSLPKRGAGADKKLKRGTPPPPPPPPAAPPPAAPPLQKQ